MDISKEELYKAIGTKIRAMRTAKGWTQEELGNKFDVWNAHSCCMRRAFGEITPKWIVHLLPTMDSGMNSMEAMPSKQERPTS